jgi:hypothetical protein
MNELLAIALDAHGGLDRWNKLKGLIAGMSISGSTWVIKGQPYLFNNIRVEMSIREQCMVTHLVGQGRKLIFEPDRIAVETEMGDPLFQRLIRGLRSKGTRSRHRGMSCMLHTSAVTRFGHT